MALYSEDEVDYARAIVESLLERGQRVDLEHDLVVSDVESDAAAFAAELEFLEDVRADAPGVRLGPEEELVPVALSLVVGARWPVDPVPTVEAWRWWRETPYFYELAAEMYRRGLYGDEGARARLEPMPLEQAHSTFLRRATEFVATRIAAIRSFREGDTSSWPGLSFLSLAPAYGANASTPGCSFIVSTNSNGLRVFWSGAYRLSANYFSAPTSPASAVLQAGTFVFGVDGGAYGNQIQWDRSAVVRLPGTPGVHLNY